MRYFARALLAGIALATLWVNIDPQSYYDAIEYRLADLPFPEGLTALPDSVTPLSVVSGGLMALVMAFIAKEFWEALAMEHGVFRRREQPGARPALLPALAIVGGAIGAVAVWLVVSAIQPRPLEAWPGAGWPVPIGADVMLAYAAGRRVFGANHPALHLLLLITIGFDISGLLIAGLAFPAAGLKPGWLVLSALAVLAAWYFAARHARPEASEQLKRRAARLWIYALAGIFCWAGIAFSGLPGALGLLPLVPVIPHANRTFGLFAEAEAHLHDPLNRLARTVVWPVAITLFLFGLTRGGLDAMALDPTTWTTLAAFLIGKPLGLLAATGLGLATGVVRLPQGVTPRDLVTLAVLAAMGFTIPALSIDASLPGGAMSEAARLGLAFTLIPGGLLALVARTRR